MGIPKKGSCRRGFIHQGSTSHNLPLIQGEVQGNQGTAVEVEVCGRSLRALPVYAWVCALGIGLEASGLVMLLVWRFESLTDDLQD